jgi:hypothetical protein
VELFQFVAITRMQQSIVFGKGCKKDILFLHEICKITFSYFLWRFLLSIPPTGCFTRINAHFVYRATYMSSDQAQARGFSNATNIIIIEIIEVWIRIGLSFILIPKRQSHDLLVFTLRRLLQTWEGQQTPCTARA